VSKCRSPGPESQRGVVLISVLLIVALLTALAYQLAERHSIAIAQSRNALGHDQAVAYALGAETFARQILYDDFTESGPGVDNFEEAWAQPLVPFDLDDGGVLEVNVRDLNGCFNLNALANTEDTQALEQLRRLLRNLGMPETVADAWRDWVDGDQEIAGFGAEDADYLLETIPYRTADRPAGHVSELRLVKGVEPGMPDALAPHVCVLPNTEQHLNVNTATAVVLASLADELDEGALLAVTGAPREFETVEEFTSEFAIPEPVAQATLAVTSEYFDVQVRAQIGDGTAVITSRLHRNPQDGRLTLLYRDMGKDFRSAVVAEDGEPQAGDDL
jgi:general secretion pathway protein K